MKKYGRGPWYVATLRNVAKHNVTLSYVHSYAYKAAAVLNVLNPGDNWITVRIVGPYDCLDDALESSNDYTVYEWTIESNAPVVVQTPKRLKMKDLK